jgi:hypothetical protein
VLAGFQRGLRHRAVQMIGRADVHDLHLRIGDHVLDIPVGARDIPRCAASCALR